MARRGHSAGIGLVNALSKAQDVAWHGGVYGRPPPLLGK